MEKHQGRNMNFEIQFIPEAAEDCTSLAGSIKNKSMKKLIWKAWFLSPFRAGTHRKDLRAAMRRR
jgi:hypothetical protein